MKDSVQSLRKLSRNDTNSKLQLIMERVEDECHKLRGNIVKTSFHGKAKYLYHIIVTMVVVTTILAWRVLSNGTWQAGILYPLLAGSVTWLALQYDFSDHDRISSTTMEVSWEVVKLCARLIYVIVLGFMCLDFLVGQLGQDITFPRLFPLRFGMSTTQKKI
ncbi:hypothetical protein BD410DRAFT_553950 [Rickenella mellea]|uniref:Uncharacterized protein n=1 Tax=Rickenella mellea TaxID=50990 RepID=A0A4Y7PQK2_9AGAM|nr:hypothetical protein BD410DRAFT_553950 [Rickenella mellea]